MTGEGRAYPLPDDDDERFTPGLLLDVAMVLDRHGYPAPTNLDLAALQQALFALLHGGEDPP